MRASTGSTRRRTPNRSIHWLVFDPDNSSGILSCFEAARRNARAVRTALTVDMWEALNDSWNHLRNLVARRRPRASSCRISSAGCRNASRCSMARRTTPCCATSPGDFVHLGTMLERADNTARLLDVKHELFDPGRGGRRSTTCSGRRCCVRSRRCAAYQWVYRERLSARRIAELMILRPELPRSLRCLLCRGGGYAGGDRIGQGGRMGECHRQAGC